MANPKYSEILRNPYTGEEIEITASKEDIFLRKRDAQIDKWENEQYVKEQQLEAQRLTQQLQNCLFGVRIKPVRVIHRKYNFNTKEGSWALITLDPSLLFRLCFFHSPTRYRAPETPAVAVVLPDGRVRVEFETPVRAVTPGQTVVLYQGDLVAGGGRILPPQEEVPIP